MPLLYASGTFGPQSLTGSGNVIVTHTMTGNGRVGVSLVLTGLHQDAATLTLTLETLDGSNNSHGLVTEVFTKSTSITRMRLELERTYFLPSGYKAKLKLMSTGSNNTSVTCLYYLFDPNHANEVAALASEALNSIIDGVWEESWVDHFNTADSVAELLVITASIASDASSYAEQVLEDTGTTGVVLASSHDVYHADIDVAVDFEDTKDEYTITWFKNGVRLTGSGSSSSANLQVVKRDGTNLLSVTPDAIGTTGSYQYTEETARIDPGVPVIVVASATIDSATRSFAKLVSRDKPA